MKEKNDFFLKPRKMKVEDWTIKLTIAGFIMALLFSFPAPANQLFDMQQTDRFVNGSINDTKGEPLIGVNVIEAGTSNGTITDIDGNYTLKRLYNESSG